MAVDGEANTDSGTRLVPAGGQQKVDDTTSILEGRYAAWLTANATWKDFIRDEDAIGSAEYDEVTATLRKARESASQMPPKCMADLAALLHIWSDEYGPCFTEDELQLPDEAHDPASLFIARMWRAATGLDGWPRQIFGVNAGGP